MTTRAEILAAALRGEDADWEFKAAKGGFPGSFWESYSAMANSDGGAVLLGVGERDGNIHVDGLTPVQIASYRKTLWDGLNNRGIVSRNLLTEADVRDVALPVTGHTATILVIDIPRAGRTARPVHIGQNPFGGTFRRRHEGDYRCPDDEIRRMIADASPEPADHRIVAGFTLADLDALSLAQYRQRMLAVRSEHPWLLLRDQQLLEQLGGWRRDRSSGAEGLTLAALLMFGKVAAIQDPGAAPHYFVDYRERLDPTIRWTDRVYPDGTWQANLFQFYLRVWPKLAAALPTPFAIEGGVRRDDSDAHVALREALVNSLIHADYSEAGGVVIEREPDLIRMANPGTLLVSLDQYQRGGVSECRNKALQRMFLMIGGGEQAGSGAARIRSGWQSRSWRAPWVVTQSDPDRVTLYLPMVSLIPDAVIRQLREKFGERLHLLSADELQALATALLEDGVSNARLQLLTTLHSSDITKLLQGLCERGFLGADGYGRWTRYHLDEGAIPSSPMTRQAPVDAGQADARSETTSRNLGPLGGSSGPLSESSGLLSGSSGLLSGSSGPSSAPNPAQGPSPPAGVESPGPTLWSLAEQSAFGEVSSDVLVALRRIAEPVARSGKAARALVTQTVRELCQVQPLTAEQLGVLLNRSAERLRKDYLSPMVDRRELRYRSPDKPQAPNQAYLAPPAADAPV